MLNKATLSGKGRTLWSSLVWLIVDPLFMGSVVWFDVYTNNRENRPSPVAHSV